MTAYETKNLLTMLGFSPKVVAESDARELAALVQAQYRALSQVLHPDKGGDPTRFAEVTAAKEALLEDPVLMDVARKELLRATAIQGDLDTARWLFNNPEDFRVLPRLKGNLVEFVTATTLGTAICKLRGVTYTIYDEVLATKLQWTSVIAKRDALLSAPHAADDAELDKRASASLVTGETTGATSADALLRKVDTLTRKLMKAGETQENAQNEAWRQLTKSTLEVREDGVIVHRVKGKETARWSDKVLVGITQYFHSLSSNFGQASQFVRDYGAPGLEGSVVSPNMHRRSQNELEKLIFIDRESPHCIPLSRAGIMVRDLYTTLSPDVRHYCLVSLNFPKGEEPYFKVEGGILSAKGTRDGEVVELLDPEGQDGTDDS